MSRPYYPNGHADRLSALLVSVDPKAPLYGSLHVIETETPILGFERDADGKLWPVTLIEQREGESLIVVDRTGKQPCWFDFATGKRFDKWRDIVDIVMSRHEQRKREQQPSEAPGLTEPSIGPVADHFGVGQDRPRWRPETSPGGTPPGKG